MSSNVVTYWHVHILEDFIHSKWELCEGAVGLPRPVSVVFDFDCQELCLVKLQSNHIDRNSRENLTSLQFPWAHRTLSSSLVVLSLSMATMSSETASAIRSILSVATSASYSSSTTSKDTSQELVDVVTNIGSLWPHISEEGRIEILFQVRLSIWHSFINDSEYSLWALVWLGNLQEWMLVFSPLLAHLTEVKVLAHAALVSYADDWFSIASVTCHIMVNDIIVGLLLLEIVDILWLSNVFTIHQRVEDVSFLLFKLLFDQLFESLSWQTSMVFFQFIFHLFSELSSLLSLSQSLFFGLLGDTIFVLLVITLNNFI